jgi:hypothetical protein
MLTNTTIEISPEHWMRWKQDPVTIEVFRVLHTDLEVWITQLVEGYTLESTGQEVALTAKAVGAVAGLKTILVDLEMELREQWEEQKREREEERDGKQIGSTAGRI